MSKFEYLLGFVFIAFASIIFLGMLSALAIPPIWHQYVMVGSEISWFLGNTNFFLYLMAGMVGVTILLVGLILIVEERQSKARKTIRQALLEQRASNDGQETNVAA